MIWNIDSIIVQTYYMGNIKEITKELFSIFLILFYSFMGVSFCCIIVYKSVIGFYDIIIWVFGGGLTSLKYGNNPIFAVILFLCVILGISSLFGVLYLYGWLAFIFGFGYLGIGFKTILKSIKNIKNLL